jgi:phosphorylcholine metabolism protein LicD
MYRLLDNVTDALKHHSIAHHIDCGTLLGCIRENGLLSNDTDVDVSIHLDDWDALKQIDFSKFGLVKILESDNVLGYGRIIRVHSPEETLYCDIHANPGFPHLETVTVTIPNGETRTYNIPIQSDLYLTILYGDWRVPSNKHAAWPEFFYTDLLMSEYEPYWDRYTYIH